MAWSLFFSSPLIQTLGQSFPETISAWAVLPRPRESLPALLRAVLGWRISSHVGHFDVPQDARLDREPLLDCASPMILGWDADRTMLVGAVMLGDLEAMSRFPWHLIALEERDAARIGRFTFGRLRLRPSFRWGEEASGSRWYLSYGTTGEALCFAAGPDLEAVETEQRRMLRRVIGRDRPLEVSPLLQPLLDAAQETTATMALSIDLRPITSQFALRPSTLAITAEELGVTGWQSLQGRVFWNDRELDADLYILRDAEREQTPPLLAMAPVGEGTSHTLSPGAAASIAVRFRGLEPVYDAWRQVLLESSYGRNALALEEAEEDLALRLGFPLRDLLLPILGGDVVLALQEAPGPGTAPVWRLTLPTRDEALARRLLETAFRRMGAEVTPAADGIHQAQLPGEGAGPVAWRIEGGMLSVAMGSHAARALQGEGAGFSGRQAEAGAVPDSPLHMTADLLHFAPAFARGLRQVFAPPRTTPERFASLITERSLPASLTLTSVSPGSLRFHLSLNLRGRAAFLQEDWLAFSQRMERRMEAKRLLTRLRLWRVSNALRMHYITHQSLPESLEELGLPVGELEDPFARVGNTPLGYIAQGPTTWMVYSRGEDGRDDGGNRDCRTFPLRWSCDIVERGGFGMGP